jgi:hypothetical protein
MAAPTLNLDKIVAAVTRAVGIQDSATAFITNAGEAIKEAVRVALEADDAADQGSIDAAMAAADAKIAELEGASDRLGAALESTTPTP